MTIVSFQSDYETSFYYKRLQLFISNLNSFLILKYQPSKQLQLRIFNHILNRQSTKDFNRSNCNLATNIPHCGMFLHIPQYTCRPI